MRTFYPVPTTLEKMLGVKVLVRVRPKLRVRHLVVTVGVRVRGKGMNDVNDEIVRLDSVCVCDYLVVPL